MGTNSYHERINVAVVSEKGQVTIPRRLRERLGIRAGQELEFSEEGGRLVARKVERSSRTDLVYGVLKSRGTADDLMEQLRGPVEGV